MTPLPIPNDYPRKLHFLGTIIFSSKQWARIQAELGPSLYPLRVHMHLPFYKKSYDLFMSIKTWNNG